MLYSLQAISLDLLLEIWPMKLQFNLNRFSKPIWPTRFCKPILHPKCIKFWEFLGKDSGNFSSNRRTLLVFWGPVIELLCLFSCQVKLTPCLWLTNQRLHYVDLLLIEQLATQSRFSVTGIKTIFLFKVTENVLKALFVFFNYIHYTSLHLCP